MDVVMLVARLVLAAVFLVAGAAKLADLAGSRRAMRSFGVPAPLAGPLGVALPLAELAVAVLLLPTATAWWGALGALALLLAFVAGIAASLVRGERPDCHCFGQLHSEPAGPATLLRNGALTAVAVVILWWGRDDTGPSVVAWIGGWSTVERVGLATACLALILAMIEGWAIVHVLRQNGRLLLRLDALEGSGALADGAPSAATLGLPLGTPAPAFSLAEPQGETVALDALRAAGKPVLLVFSDPDCDPCNALLPEIGHWQRAHGTALTLAVLSRGDADRAQAKRTEHGLTHVLLQPDRAVVDAYRVEATPTGVLINANGTVGSPLALGPAAIRALVERTVATGAWAPVIPLRAVPNHAGAARAAGTTDPRPAPTPIVASRIGTPAPTLRLPDLDGHEVDLASFRGEPVLVLFWDPACGFCARMLEDLRAWEALTPPGAPRLLVVSTGSVEANTALGLRSTVVLDQGFAAGRSFGARGTPAGVLVDADGLIASDVAGGAPAVLQLAGALPRTG